MNEPKDYSYDELLRFSRALMAENTELRVQAKAAKLDEFVERQRCVRVCRHVIQDWGSHPCIDAIADAMEDAIRGINVPHGTQGKLSKKTTIAVMAGNYQQWLEFNRAHLESKNIYCDDVLRIAGIKFDDAEIVGTFKQRKDAAEIMHQVTLQTRKGS